MLIQNKTRLVFQIIWLSLLLTSCQSPPPDTSTVLQDHFTPYPNKVLTIDYSRAASRMEDQAMRLYEQERYDQAVILFNELIQQETSVEGRYNWVFYKGNAQLAQGSVEAARATFSYIPENEKLYPESLWCQALCLLHLNRLEEARQLLKKIPAGSARHQAAQELLETYY